MEVRNGKWNYCYDLEMTTPLGIRRGNLELRRHGDDLSGVLTMFTRTIPIQEGRCSGNHISFRGDMKTLMKLLPYRAEGELGEHGLALQITTEQGCYPTKGVLVEKRRD